MGKRENNERDAGEGSRAYMSQKKKKKEYKQTRRNGGIGTDKGNRVEGGRKEGENTKIENKKHTSK